MQTRTQESYKNVVFTPTGFTFKGVQYEYEGYNERKLDGIPGFARIILGLQYAQGFWNRFSGSIMLPDDHFSLIRRMIGLSSDEEKRALALPAMVNLFRDQELGTIHAQIMKGIDDEFAGKNTEPRRFVRLVLGNPEIAHYLSALKATEMIRIIGLLGKHNQLIPSFNPSTDREVHQDDITSLFWIKSRDSPKLRFDYETGKVVPINA